MAGEPLSPPEHLSHHPSTGGYGSRTRPCPSVRLGFIKQWEIKVSFGNVDLLCNNETAMIHNLVEWTLLPWWWCSESGFRLLPSHPSCSGSIGKRVHRTFGFTIVKRYFIHCSSVPDFAVWLPSVHSSRKTTFSLANASDTTPRIRDFHPLGKITLVVFMLSKVYLYI